VGRNLHIPKKWPVPLNSTCADRMSARHAENVKVKDIQNLTRCKGEPSELLLGQTRLDRVHRDCVGFVANRNESAVGAGLHGYG
jgi:hypothetical protein